MDNLASLGRRNKKGVLGSLVTTIIATIVIITILAIFVFISGAVKLFSTSDDQLIQNELSSGIGDVFFYMDFFYRATRQTKFEWAKGEDVLDNGVIVK